MNLLRSLPKPHSRHHLRNHYNQSNGSCFDATAIKCVRDRGLDHAVERERNLRPLLNLKDLIKSEPSKSIPLSIISRNKDNLRIPIRPVEFIRKYPSIFQEYFPGGIEILPHVKLTPEILGLDSDEQLIYQSEIYKQDVADRLLKLLMIGRINKIPLLLIDKLKWELGLPQDYVKTIVPEFPDYFRVTATGSEDPMLELVCWSNDLSVSAMEKKLINAEKGHEGTTIAFPLILSTGFEMDKKYKKWINEWQKLPYISPYENAMHLASKSDESDRWVVAVLHEVLNLFVAKKADRESVLCLGEYFGLRSRFKRALLYHPGIFYISNKIRMYTVVLKEAYKRGLLIERNTLMDMRSRYIHLMNMVQEENKSKKVHNNRKQNVGIDSQAKEEAEMEDDESGNEENDEFYGLSDSEAEVSDYKDEDINENATNRGRASRMIKFEDKIPSRVVTPRSAWKNNSRSINQSVSSFKNNNRSKNQSVSSWKNNSRSKNQSGYSRRSEERGVQNIHTRLPKRSDGPRIRKRTNFGKNVSTL